MIFHGAGDSLHLNIKIGDAYKYMGRPTRAQLWYEKTVDLGHESIAKKALFKLVELDLLKEKPSLARFELQEMKSYSFNTDDSAHWEFLWALSHVYDFENDSAKALLSLIHKDSPYYKKSSRILDRIKEYEKIPLKNPFLAMAFSSIVPGSGQYYMGRKKEALGAFMLHSGLGALLSYTVYKGFQAHRNGKVGERRIAVMDFSIVFTMIFLRYYNGGRMNAFKYALEYNAKVQKNYLKGISEDAGL
jgi:hypothetical protein